MNAVTATESQALATLPPAARAALAMGSTATELALRELVKASASIVTVTNKAGREECHTAYMVLKNSRVAVDHAETAATEDAKLFTKAVKAEAVRLSTIITAEEARLKKLRDDFDAIEQARKDAEQAAEVERIMKIASAIEGIRERGTDAAFIDKTAASTQATLANLEALAITEEIYQERLAEATELKDSTLAKVREILATRVAAEAAEAQRLADIAAADKRRADEAAELARQRADQERAAAELAATAKRLADQQAAIDLAAKQQRDQAEANARAHAAALADVEAKAQAERDRVAAANKAQLEAQQAEIAAAQRRLAEQQAAADARDAAARQALEDAAHAAECYDEAMADNAKFDAEAEVARLQAAAEQHLADAREPMAPVEHMVEIAMAPADLLDAADDEDLDPSDAEIIAMGAECGLEPAAWVERLRLFVAAHAAAA